MKKVFLILFVLIGFGISVNAQTTKTVTGTIKMYLLNEEGSVTPINTWRKTDWTEEVIIYVLRTDPLDISSGDGCKDCKDVTVTSEIVLRAADNHSFDFVKLNNQKIRVTGSIDCPCAGWRNYNGIIMRVTKVERL